MSRTDETLVIRNADLSAAVASGICDEATAARLVQFVSSGGASPNAETENFRLITGFNDVFVTIGLALFLGAVVALTAGLLPYLLIPLTWGLAEVFTKRMRMALPSIILLLAFVVSIAWGVALLFHDNPFDIDELNFRNAIGVILGFAAAAMGAAFHWWRFHVPITLAAGVAAAAGVVFFTITSSAPALSEAVGSLIILPMGLATFFLAMYHDTKDRSRRTQLSDRAFWLHMLAAPMIVHPLVQNIAKSDGVLSGSSTALIIGIFVVLSVVALIIDRRALLVSSLTYLGYAFYSLMNISVFGADGAGTAVLSVGVVVLLLSVAWKPLRSMIVSRLPARWQEIVPPATSLNVRP